MIVRHVVQPIELPVVWNTSPEAVGGAHLNVAKRVPEYDANEFAHSGHRRLNPLINR